jgi:hypothetical protein
MFDITPFRNLPTEYPPLVQPLLPSDMTLELYQRALRHGRVTVNYQGHVYDFNLIENIARAGTREGFLGNVQCSLENLATFIETVTKSRWPLLNGDVAEFATRFMENSAEVSLVTASKRHILGHLTYEAAETDGHRPIV